MKIQKIVTVLLVSMTFWSCEKDNSDEILQQDIAKIEKYILDNNLNAFSLNTGLYYVIERQGNGVNPTRNSTVLIRYKGYLLDGTIFDDDNQHTPIDFNLSGLIEGWRQGLPLFKEGGEGKLLIPSTLGYGEQSVGNIPPNSVLIFDIELVAVY